MKNTKQKLYEMMHKVAGMSLNESAMVSEAPSKSLIKKYVMFSFNYGRNFIEEIWADEPRMADHLRSKFDDYYTRYGSGAVMNYFYNSLDDGNTQKFENYIANDYLGESDGNIND